MTCYKPKIRAEDLTKWVKAKDGHLYHPAKIFSTDRLEEFDQKFRVGNYKYQQIPCKECIGCRLDYSRDWANRGYLEGLQWNQNYFVTLTYDENHINIPEELTTTEGVTYTEIEELEWKGILVPKELQQFLKNIRQILKREFNHDNMRFIACGEYGAQNGGKRPHYHLILFNCPLPIESFYKPRISWNKDTYFQNEILERAWSKGISNISEANWNNIAYTARYITKKINGKESEDYYAMQGQIKEFLRSSRKPGIAKGYYDEHKKEIYEKDQILIRNREGAFWVSPPKYFDRLYEKEDPEHMAWIKKERERKQLNALKVKALTTSLTRWEQLQVEMDYKEEATTALGRNKLDTLSDTQK